MTFSLRAGVRVYGGVMGVVRWVIGVGVQDVGKNDSSTPDRVTLSA